MSLRDTQTLLEGETLCPEVDLYRVAPCALASDAISDILMRTKEPSLLLTGLTNDQIIHFNDIAYITNTIFIQDRKSFENHTKSAQEHLWQTNHRFRTKQIIEKEELWHP